MELNNNSIIERTSEIVEAEVDGEMVMMSVDSGAYYGLNEVGKNIWQQLTEKKSVEDICKTLKKEFDVDDQTCESEVITFLDLLQKDALVTVTKH